MRLAALACAVAAAVFAPGALAGIVYSLPPQPITVAAVFPDTNPGSNHPAAPLDINHDGVAEFTINAQYQRTTGFPTRGTYFRVERPGVAVRWAEGEGFALLGAGTLVSGSDYFLDHERHEFAWEVGLGGWGLWEYGDPPAYVGFTFDINGRMHVGWARAQINILPVPGYMITVLDYAYESEPGVAIVAGAIPSPGAAVGVGPMVLFGPIRRRR